MVDPLIFKAMIDNYVVKFAELSWHDFITGVLWLMLLSMVVALFARISKHLQNFYVSATSQKMGAGIYAEAIGHVLSLPYEIFEDERSGDLLEKLQKARTDLQQFIVMFINMAFSLFIGIVFVLTYGFFVHPAIGLGYLLIIPLLAWVSFYMGRRIKKAQRQIITQGGALAGSTTETIRNIELVKSLGLEQREIQRLNNSNEAILGLELQKIKTIRMLGFVQDTILNLLRSGMMLVLFWLVFKGYVSVGNFFTLQIYSFFIFNPLSEIGAVVTSYQEAKAGLEIVQKTINKKPVNVTPGTVAVRAVDSVQFSGVDFKYKDSETEVLKNINFTLKKGDTVSFVGATGSGKTTILKLILGLYKLRGGNIVVNGVDSAQINYDSLRARVGYVSQDTQLFTGTVRDNLLFVKADATDDECKEALELASAVSIIEKTDKGLDTKIGEGGLKLSGGEKQRLAIARALLRKPNIIIFDEATSSLDLLTEKSLNDTIKNIVSKKADLITIIVAHRLSAVAASNTIYVLENHTISEQGNHAELLENKGLYYALWRQQGASGHV